MKITRVVLAGMPRILTEMVRGIILSQPDFEVAGEIVGGNGLLLALREIEPDVLVIGRQAEGNASFDDTLYQQPHLRIVAIGRDGREASLHEMSPHVVQLGEVSAIRLVSAIRGMADPLPSGVQ